MREKKFSMLKFVKIRKKGNAAFLWFEVLVSILRKGMEENKDYKHPS